MKKILSVCVALFLMCFLSSCDFDHVEGAIDQAVGFITDSGKEVTNSMSPIKLLDDFRAAERPDSITSADGTLVASVTESGTIGYIYRPSAGTTSETPWWRESKTPDGVTFGVSAMTDANGDKFTYVSTNVYPDVGESGLLADLDSPKPLGTARTPDGTLLCYVDEVALYRDGSEQWSEAFALSGGWFYSPPCNWLYNGKSCIVMPGSNGLDLFSDHVVDVISYESSVYALTIDAEGQLQFDGTYSADGQTVLQHAYAAASQDTLPAVVNAQFLNDTILCQCEDGSTYALHASNYFDLFEEARAADAEYLYIGNKSVGYYADMWYNSYLVREDIQEASASIWDFLERCMNGEY